MLVTLCVCGWAVVFRIALSYWFSLSMPRFFDNLSEELVSLDHARHEYLLAASRALSEILPAAKVFKPHLEKMKV